MPDQHRVELPGTGYHTPAPLQQVGRTYVRYRGRTLTYFSGCDYYRLSSHPRLQAALVAGVKRYGVNVAASRLTTGNHVLFGELEHRLAEFFRAPAATLVPTGYNANQIAAQALAGRFTHALVDAQAHASLTDAARFLEAPVSGFAHHDPQDLAVQAARCGKQARVLVLLDGLCSRDGSAAPLAEYLDCLPKTAWLLVDDAHGAGVLGAHGRGTPEHAGISRQQVIQTITLSKAFGSYGGAILGEPWLAEAILTRSVAFAASTPLPLPMVCAALEGLRLLRAYPRFRDTLHQNAALVKGRLRAAGLPLPETPGPIFGLLPSNAPAAAALRRRLLRARIFPPFIRYPGGPPGGYFRFVVSSEHDREQLDGLVDALAGTADYLARRTP